MAPELIKALMPNARLTQMPKPSNYTDLHSLAVLIYLGLLFRHPLRGSRFLSPIPNWTICWHWGKKRSTSKHPKEYPKEKANRPKGAYIPAATLGAEMSALLLRAFDAGLRDPKSRPKAGEWERALLHMYDQTVPCNNPLCEARSFVLLAETKKCPWCGWPLRSGTPQQQMRAVPLLSCYRAEARGNGFALPHGAPEFTITGWPHRTLHIWHTLVEKMPGPSTNPAPQAEILWQRAGRSEQWVLHNRGYRPLTAVESGKGGYDVPVGGQVELKEGMSLLFGGVSSPRLMVVQMQRL